MKINVIDLFAGCGGLTDGFLQTGKYNSGNLLASMNFKNNAIRYIFLILSVVFLIVLQFAAIPLIIALYIVLSLLTRSKIY